MTDEYEETNAPPEDSSPPPELTADEKALLEEMPTLANVGQSRRAFLGQTIAGSLGLFALDLLALESRLAAMAPAPGALHATQAAENVVRTAFSVNGVTQTLDLDSRVVLLVAPVADGRVGTPALFDVDGESAIPRRFALEAVERRADDVIWLRYRVESR